MYRVEDQQSHIRLILNSILWGVCFGNVECIEIRQFLLPELKLWKPEEPDA
jgi:hypothetical protein